MLDYHCLNQDFIREYCEDNLKAAKDHVSMVCAISQVFSSFNFDMLKALVEEMNRYGETPAEALKFLNARPDFDVSTHYKVQLIMDEKEVDNSTTKWRGNLIKDVIHVYYDEGKKLINFSAQDFKQVDPRTGAYVFKKKKGHTLVLWPIKSNPTVSFETIQHIDTTHTPLTESDSDDGECVMASCDWG
jgi:hypothetical protein